MADAMDTLKNILGDDAEDKIKTVMNSLSSGDNTSEGIDSANGLNQIMQIKNIIPEIISTGVMTICALVLKQVSDQFIWEFISIAICIILYFRILLFLPYHRQEIWGLIKPYIQKIRQKLHC